MLTVITNCHVLPIGYCTCNSVVTHITTANAVSYDCACNSHTSTVSFRIEIKAYTYVG